ncbi:MAG TPA: cytochrome c oxidase subunit 3 [Polyangiaceae bacterium]|nr:cytochrome c oxidase subunit 3 [Polyangiaceae bacterium]
MSAPQLALYVGMGSMSVLFAACLVAYFVTRAQSKTWRSVDLPQLPWGLWVSTVTLVAVSWCLRQAVASITRNQSVRLTRHLFAAFLLGLSFCAVQADNWRRVLVAVLAVEVKSLYTYTFFMLTALHVVHVLAGLIPLWITHRRAADRLYSSSRFEGVRLVRQYWDFLLVVWLILLAALSLS